MKQLFDGILHDDIDFDLNGRSKLTGKKLCGDKLVDYKKRLNIAMVKSNNPKGYNKHNKNPKVEVIKKEKVTRQQVQEAYKELWIAKRNTLSKAQKFARLNRIFMSYDKIDEELSLEYKDK